ncbi:MAG: metal-dependent hydrolase [Thermoplasmata archaeon]
MDLFTHVIFAYLLSFIIWGPAAPQYIAAGALAGGLPDADVLLFPLTRWFPSLHHRGAVHTVLGVTLIAAVGSFLVPFLPYFTHASILLYFVAMEIGGLSHLALDGFTNYSVRPLLPFSGRALRLNADVAVSLVTMALTGVTMVVLILEHGTVPFGVWEETAWILIGVYGGYLVLRGVARWRAGVLRRRFGYTEVLPSTNPWKWLLLEEVDTAERYHIRFRRLALGSGLSGDDRSLDVTKVPQSTGPVESPHAALERTYLAAMAESEWLAESYHFGEATEKGSVYEVWWYMISQAAGRRAYGVHGEIDRVTGAMRLRSGFLRLPSVAPM